MKEQWFKSGLFVLAVHFLSLTNILLCQYDIWGDIAWLFCQLIICIIEGCNLQIWVCRC